MFVNEFDTMADYEAYNQTFPDHTSLYSTYWAKYVDKFLELDYEAILVRRKTKAYVWFL